MYDDCYRVVLEDKWIKYLKKKMIDSSDRRYNVCKVDICPL